MSTLTTRTYTASGTASNGKPYTISVKFNSADNYSTKLTGSGADFSINVGGVSYSNSGNSVAGWYHWNGNVGPATIIVFHTLIYSNADSPSDVAFGFAGTTVKDDYSSLVGAISLSIEGGSITADNVTFK